MDSLKTDFDQMPHNVRKNAFAIDVLRKTDGTSIYHGHWNLFNLIRDNLSSHYAGLVVVNRASHLCDPGSTLAWVVCGLSFSRSQPDSEGFPPGTPVFLPPQNRLPVKYIWLGLHCSEITHGSYGASRGRLHMYSV